MPRLHPRLFRQAHAINSLLPKLLPVCRDIRSAQNELRWLAEHAKDTLRYNATASEDELLFQYVQRRARGEPLQFIFGSEFFGDLEIKCRPGVLIPRQETAASVTHLINRLSARKASTAFPSTLRVLDLCTGTGCIPLLFQHEFYFKQVNGNTQLHLVGVDISPKALSLARENHRIQLQAQRSTSLRQREAVQNMHFVQADVLQEALLLQALKLHTSDSGFDILISNPPYISPTSFQRSTSPSVRHFEPRLALVPEDQDEDSFYPRLLHIAAQLDVQVALFEVADLEQAKRVATMAIKQEHWSGAQIWRDEPASGIMAELEGQVPIVGSGNGRSVLLYRGNGKDWLGLT